MAIFAIVSLSHSPTSLFFSPGTIHCVFPDKGSLFSRSRAKTSEGLTATHRVLQPMVEHARRARCITYQSSCRGRLTQREGENITRNDQNMQMITSSRTTLISFFPSQSLADRPVRPDRDRPSEKTFLQGNATRPRVVHNSCEKKFII